MEEREEKREQGREPEPPEDQEKRLEDLDVPGDKEEDLKGGARADRRAGPLR